MTVDSDNGASHQNPTEEVENNPDRTSDELLIDWEGDHDTANPFNWSWHRKWLVTSTASFVAFLVGINSSSITSAAESINEQFGISDAHFPTSYWTITAWNTAAGITPMVVLPLMENFGIRTWYLSLYGIFTLFVIPQAVANNFATLIVTRIFAGASAGVLQNICDAMIAEIWQDEHSRSLPVTFYIFCLLGGVSVGPVFGGAIISHLDWRWIFYIQLIIYAAFFPFVYLVITETRPSIILKYRAKKIEKQLGTPTKAAGEPNLNVMGLLKDGVIRPVHLLFKEPAIFSLALLSSYGFGLVFIASQSAGAHVFPQTFGFNESQASLVQASLVIGEVIGALTCVIHHWIFSYLYKGKEPENGKPITEPRLPLSIFGCFVGLMGGLFFYAWTSDSSFHWVVPCIGLGFVGFGIMIVVQAVGTFITTAYAPIAASAVAGVALGENLFAAWLPLSTHAMYTDLGFKWASSTLAFLALALSFAPVVLLFKGYR